MIESLTPEQIEEIKKRLLARLEEKMLRDMVKDGVGHRGFDGGMFLDPDTGRMVFL